MKKKKDYKEMGFGEANAGEVFGFGSLQRRLVETSLAWLSFAFFVIVLLVRVRMLILESSFSKSVISFCFKKISNSTILNKWESFSGTVDHVSCAPWRSYNFFFLSSLSFTIIYYPAKFELLSFVSNVNTRLKH